MLVLALDVATEDDLPRAVAFYEAALEITSTTDLNHGKIRLEFREAWLVLSAEPLREEFYEKGRTPRLQIQVDDVGESARRFLDCGARLARDKGGQSSAIPESAAYVELVDPDAAVSLIDSGMPFTLITTYVDAAHAQVVTGYDSRRACLLIRDPSSLSIVEYDWEKLAEAERAFGPRGMVMVPQGATAAQTLATMALPDADLYDLRFELEDALVRHDRAHAIAVLATIHAAAPADHRLVLRCDRALAHYDDDGRAELAWTDAMLAAHPNDPRLLLLKLGAMPGLAPFADQLVVAEMATREKHPAPELLAEHAFLLAQTPLGKTRAIGMLRRAARAAPTSGLILRALANELWDAGKFAASVPLYRFASCLGASDEGAARGYFLAARHVGLAEEALAHLRKRVASMGARSPPARDPHPSLRARRRQGLSLVVARSFALATVPRASR